jgi:hypothetical protein
MPRRPWPWRPLTSTGREPAVAWLTRDDEVLATIEPCRPGWRRDLDGVVVLKRPCLVPTLAERVPLDLAWCSPGTVDGSVPTSGSLLVRRIRTASARPALVACVRYAVLVVAPAAAFDRWRLRVGDRLEVRGG